MAFRTVISRMHDAETLPISASMLPPAPSIKRLIRLASLPLVLPYLAACVSDTVTIPPIAAPRLELPGTTPQFGVSAGLQREHQKLVAGFGGEYRAPALQAVLNEVAERLRLVSDRPNDPARVTILNASSVNAFALPNGNIYLTRGLIALANDTAEIASVIAHEMAHVTQRHASERAEFENRAVLVSRVQSEVLDNANASRMMRDQSRVALASFSRRQEIEADEAGVRAIARAGYEAEGAARFLIALDRSARMREAVSTTGDKADILATHPTTPERLERVVAVVRQYGSPGVGEANRPAWLEVVNGILYGDDPTHGLIEGQRFVHPRQRFAIEAPAGFVLENTPQAVLGVTQGAAQAMRLDFRRGELEKPLRSLLAENPIEGLPVTDLTDDTIAGFSAARGLARGPDWTFRVILLRAGDVTYRLIYAGQNFTAEMDQQFLRSANSFRQLSEQDVRAVRAQRIALIFARAGDRPEDIVNAHMRAIPQGLERFLILNGLGPDDPLVPGQSYKVVTGGDS
jgi:predicted Zn-dependent protease